MFVDYVFNGQSHGEVGEMLSGCHFDPGYLRPYIDENGVKCVTVNTGRTKWDESRKMMVPVREKRRVKDVIASGVESPAFNSALTLRKDEWIMLDRSVQLAARPRLRAWSDLSAAATYGGFDGMSKTILENQAMSDPGEAIVDMDGITEVRGDTPLFNLMGLPLPITHSGFFYSKRQLAVSRSGGSPLDVLQAEAAGRRVAEMIEKTTIGVQTGASYGKASNYTDSTIPTVYGYINYPYVVSKTDVTTPTGSNPHSTVNDVLAMIQELQDISFYGPYMLYHSPDWGKFLDGDYFNITTSGAVAPTQTLRNRIRQIEGIQDVRQLDYLSSKTFHLILVQMTSNVCRAVNGLDITTVQWESQGGMRLNFKVMAIHVPQMRRDYNNKTGICLGTTS